MGALIWAAAGFEPDLEMVVTSVGLGPSSPTHESIGKPKRRWFLSVY